MATIYNGTVLAESVAIRTGPGLNYSSSDDIRSKGDTFFITDIDTEARRVWGKMDAGWICLINGSDRYVDYHIYEKPTRIMFRAATASDADATPNESTDTTTNIVDGAGATVATTTASMETFQSAFGSLLAGSVNNGELLKKTMRLFGLPYQFRKEIDTRVDNVSTTVGRKFVENIISEAPVVTIIPGKPTYLPGAGDKSGWTHAFMQAANGNFAELQQKASDNEGGEVRYYDFEQCYTEYMKYVNIMCRAAATFLELTEEIDGTPLQKYDWRNYRWTGENYKTVSGNLMTATLKGSTKVLNGIINGIASYGADAMNAINTLFNGNASTTGNNMEYITTESTDEQDAFVDSLLQTCNFVQFYADPEMGASESASNSTSESKIKGMFDSGSDMLKELAFVSNSSGANATDMTDFMGSSANALSDALSGGNGVTSFLKRLLDVSGNVMKGENVIMPEIYQNSQYERSYSINVHLKAPYGNRFCYYMDVLVPLFHLMAFALPKQTSANTYGSPFLVKAFCEGVFTCNLGIVSSVSVNKNVSPESWTNDGFPSEIDVSLNIQDLYSDLTMSPQSSPSLFLANSSLIEYLATTCGLNLTEPQLSTKLSYTIQTIKNSFGDIGQNVVSEVTNSIDNMISPWINII